ncbi:MAG: hypothetical protein Q9201_001506 [Fulgogasparrea decipioides]
MCIHHLKYHAPCGHITQSPNSVLPCYPVSKALNFYHDQPKEASYGRGRAFGTDPMRIPEVCGASSIYLLRNLIFVGNNRSITPQGWQPPMTLRLRQLLENGEDARSAIILLETEYPQLVDNISEDWVHHLRQCFHSHGLLHWYLSEDLQNDHLAGDIVTETVTKGCGHFKSGDARCFTNWVNPIGGGPAFCPVKWSQDTGLEIPQRPDHIPAERLPGWMQGGNAPRDVFDEDSFRGKYWRELYYQAEDHAWLMSRQSDSTSSSPNTEMMVSIPSSKPPSPKHLDCLLRHLRMEAGFEMQHEQQCGSADSSMEMARQRRPSMSGQDLHPSSAKTTASQQGSHDASYAKWHHMSDMCIRGNRIPTTASSEGLRRASSEVHLKPPVEQKAGKASSVGMAGSCRDRECGLCESQ